MYVYCTCYAPICHANGMKKASFMRIIGAEEESLSAVIMEPCIVYNKKMLFCNVQFLYRDGEKGQPKVNYCYNFTDWSMRN